MNVTAKPYCHKLDVLLLTSSMVLVVMGFLMVASSSMVVADESFGGAFHFVLRQGVSLFIALLSGLLVYKVPLSIWERYSGILFFAAIIMLILVLIVGITVNGSTRWINLGVMNIQPSEIAKILIVVYLSSFIVRRQEEIKNHWSGIVKSSLILAVPALLLLLEPDFGSVVVLSTACTVMLFMGGVKIRYFFALLIGGGLLLYVLLVTQPYRMARLTAFLNPWSDPYGSAYQLIQSLIAYGRGGWFGEGYGNSVQKLFYLPEAHTDFLISILAEELGFAGIIIIVSLFTTLVVSLLLIAKQADRRRALFSAYLSYGLASLVAIQFLFNLGVSMGLLPTKGLTLPLMSYGGSSLLSTLIILAIILRVNKENREQDSRSELHRTKRGTLKNTKTGENASMGLVA